MASNLVSSGLEKLQERLDGSIEGSKLSDLRKDLKDYHDPQNRITTDYGVKQSNTGTSMPPCIVSFKISS